MTGGTAIQNEIRALIEAPLRDDSRSELEHALTDGYAHALSLEAERHRLERRLSEAVASLSRPAAARPDEVASLGRQIEETDSRLTQLRALLTSLRARFEEARA